MWRVGHSCFWRTSRLFYFSFFDFFSLKNVAHTRKVCLSGVSLSSGPERFYSPASRVFETSPDLVTSKSPPCIEKISHTLWLQFADLRAHLAGDTRRSAWRCGESQREDSS